MAKPWPKLLRDLPDGAAVRTLRPIETANMLVPAGTEARYRRSSSWNRMEVMGPACECCGVSVRIVRLPRDWLELI